MPSPPPWNHLQALLCSLAPSPWIDWTTLGFAQVPWIWQLDHCGSPSVWNHHHVTKSCSTYFPRKFESLLPILATAELTLPNWSPGSHLFCALSLSFPLKFPLHCRSTHLNTLSPMCRQAVCSVCKIQLPSAALKVCTTWIQTASPSPSPTFPGTPPSCLLRVPPGMPAT